MTEPEVRKGQASFPLARDEFEKRYRELFGDPAFDDKQAEIRSLMDAAWDGYVNERKSPRTRKAGPDFKDPDYDLSIDLHRS